ncbi:hypothetical protein P691DRAFT_624121, partial [Macrolepiota fuliginosa MF-IS2]
AWTFIRFNTRKILFLAVDGLSSAPDVEEEELLLSNLIQEREGKPIIFVMYRSG